MNTTNHPLDIGYIPSRFLSIVIFLFTALNLIFCLLPFQNNWHNIDHVARRTEIAYYFSNRSGVLSFANIALSVLFAGRNNPLMYIGDFSQTSSLAFHRWTARIATVQAIVHSILFTFTYFWTGGYVAYSTEAAKAYYWWGIMATIAMALCTGAAVLVFRIKLYETFLLVHIALAIISLIGCWYHIIQRYGKNWGYEVYLYITFAFWASDRLARFARIAIYNRKGPVSPGYAELVPGTDLIKLVIFPGSSWKFTPGQHSFIYFHTINHRPYSFWESHPFSVANWSIAASKTTGTAQSTKNTNLSDKSPTTSKETTVTFEKLAAEVSSVQAPELDPSVTFLIRTSKVKISSLRGLTNKLHSEALSVSNDSTGGSNLFPVNVSTEGPYTHSLGTISNSQVILCLAGGVGVTGLLGYVKAFIEDFHNRQPLTEHGTRQVRLQRMVFALSSREMGLIDFVKQSFPPDTLTEGLEFRFFWTGDSLSTQEGYESVARGRMDIQEMISTEAAATEKKKKLAVISCGPAGMADEIRSAVAASVRKGYWIELVEEAFAW